LQFKEFIEEFLFLSLLVLRFLSDKIDRGFKLRHPLLLHQFILRFGVLVGNSVKEIGQTEIEEWVPSILNELPLYKDIGPQSHSRVDMASENYEFIKRVLISLAKFRLSFKRIILLSFL